MPDDHEKRAPYNLPPETWRQVAEWNRDKIDEMRGNYHQTTGLLSFFCAHAWGKVEGMRQ